MAKSFWPLLKQHVIPLTTIFLAAIAIYIILLIRRLFRSHAEPDITYARIKLEPCDLPSFRYMQGSFVTVNSGRTPCNITRVQVLHENVDFQVSDISDEVREEITLQDKGKIGVKLPLVIHANRTKRVFFFGSHKLETLEELPESLSLEVTFNCRKEPFVHRLHRESATKNYVP